MPITIVATPGASNANSYVTVAECTSYWDGLTLAAWTKETDADKRAAALIIATKTLDRLRFIGKKLNDLPEGHAQYQSLEWPRKAPGFDGFYLEDDDDRILPYTYNNAGSLIIPKVVKDACCEQANFMIETGEATGELVERIRLQREGVRSFAVPGLSEQYSGRPATLYNISPAAAGLLNKYIVNASRVYRG